MQDGRRRSSAADDVARGAWLTSFTLTPILSSFNRRPHHSSSKAIASHGPDHDTAVSTIPAEALHSSTADDRSSFSRDAREPDDTDASTIWAIACAHDRSHFSERQISQVPPVPWYYEQKDIAEYCTWLHTAVSGLVKLRMPQIGGTCPTIRAPNCALTPSATNPLHTDCCPDTVCVMRGNLPPLRPSNTGSPRSCQNSALPPSSSPRSSNCRTASTSISSHG